jgi:hypothetical protein
LSGFKTIPKEPENTEIEAKKITSIFKNDKISAFSLETIQLNFHLMILDIHFPKNLPKFNSF